MRRINILSRWAALALLAWVCTLTTGCASFYVDNSLRDADSVQIKAPSSPKPVQLFFSFQTKGGPNPQATEMLRSQVVDLVGRSQLFSKITDVPLPDAGTLQITINNVPLSDDAAAKGFVTGLTLGLAGNTVGDGYVCDLQFKASDTSAPINSQVHHAIYTSLGATASAPQAATKADSLKEAVGTVVRQAVQSLLKNLSDNPQFQANP